MARGNWVILNTFKGWELFDDLKSIVVCCKAGDLVLWDSRTIHCNAPRLPSSNPEKKKIFEEIS